MRRPVPLLIVALGALAVSCDGDDGSRASSSTGATSDRSVLAPPATPTSMPAAVALDQPFVGTLTFDWPVGCAVPVEEDVTRRGQHAVLTYVVRSEETGAGIRISLDDMTIEEINGAEVPDGVTEQVVAQFTLPDVLVGADGIGTAVVGMDATLARMDDAGLIEVDELTPDVVALIEEAVLTKYWGSWVGSWADLGRLHEPRTTSVVAMPVGDSEVTVDLIVESLPAASGTAILRTVQTLAGDDLMRSLGAVVGILADDETPGSQPAGDGHRITTVEVTTDPATLRPTSASFVNDVELTIDGDTQAEVERRDWRFDWSNLTCP